MFGYNFYGQLGLNDYLKRNNPTQISLGAYHTAIIDLNDGVLVFGSNQFGQLGLGNTINRNTPTQILNIKANQVSVGGTHTIII
jgi:alpha-tubulin suppressor-like RCC1 family protein